jgi:cellulose synthase/poly-beta-1,6-N-acetylglucosamine synthase-like glycosyltransferase
MSTLVWAANILACLLSIPAWVFTLECLAAALPLRPFRGRRPDGAATLAILVPAHDEEAAIGDTVDCLRAQLASGDRLIVIADNCTDRTAEIAEGHGATVLRRHDTVRRGKGFALSYALDTLKADPPRAIVIVDADCTLEPGGIEQLREWVTATGRPAQAVYLIEAPLSPSTRDQVSALAVRVKNLVRPRGLAFFGGPCHLYGAGMAVPWTVTQQVPLEGGNIVEDMQWGIELAIAGHPPLFCPAARVLSRLPEQNSSAKTQRTRWEHGHLRTLLTQSPRLLLAGLGRGSPALIAMAIDLAVPPLSLLLMVMVAATAAAAALGIATGAWSPAWIVGGSTLAVGLGVMTAWATLARDTISAGSLLMAPLYMLWKLPIYFAFIFKRQRKWVRTERDAKPPAPSPR